MDSLAIKGDRRMTVKEVAEALGYASDTIAKKVKELYPELVENGRTTYLTEENVIKLKAQLVPRTYALKSEVGAATTALEMKQKAAEVMAWLLEDIEQKAAKIAEDAPKVEAHDALMRSDRTMSITDAAKHFGLHPKTDVFPYLREHGYLTRADLPTQAAIDAGYLELRETRCHDSEVRPQAVVTAAALLVWRSRVIPQIAHWKAGE